MQKQLQNKHCAGSPYSFRIMVLVYSFLIISLFLSNKGLAQQEAQFSNYMFNTLVYNPAYAGSKDALSIVTLYRDQWYNSGNGGGLKGIDGRPITQTFSLHAPLQKNVGVGMSIVNDKIGAHGTTSLDLSYAYRIDFGTGKLAIGLQAGVMNWRADWDQLAYKDPQHLDAAFLDNNQSLWVPNFGGGVYYSNPSFYFGVSVPRLSGFSIRENIDKTEIQRWAKTYQHLYISVGGAIPIRNRNVVFKPSFLLKSVGLFSDFLAQGDEIRGVGVPTAFELTGAFFFHEKLWLGASFRSAFSAFSEYNGVKSSHASINALLAYHFQDGGKIGFAYDYTINEINNFAPGSFEIMLGWDFIRKINKVEHPRYFF